MIRIIHDDLRVFLNTRMEANGADAEMCFRITARQDLSSDATPNYFMAIPNPADTKRAAISQTSMAAMIKAGADPYRNRDVWNAQAAYRTVLRPGRWARSMSDIEDGNTLDVFTMALDAQFGVGDIAVDVLEGRAITKAYSAEAHCQCVSIGDLANSCMRYDHNQGTFSIYERAAKLATVKCPSCKGVRARALLWEVEGVKFVDRRYGTQQHKQAILTYATQLGYTDVWPGAVGAENKHAYSLAFPYKASDIPSAPYVDSLFYWCRTCGTLSNRHRDCSNAKHDITVLRGTHGTDHSGWWGRCPDCNYQLDRHRVCPQRQTCEGCQAKWCGAKGCPNGCIRCASCGTTRAKGIEECPNGCVICNTCGTGNRRSFLNQTHGQCRGCGEVLGEREAMRYDVKLKWDRYDNLAGRCPNCEWAISAKSFSPRTGLVKCEHVHNGPYGYEGGHCPSCHAYIVLQDADQPRPEKPKATNTYTYSTGMNMPLNGEKAWNEYKFKIRG